MILSHTNCLKIRAVLDYNFDKLKVFFFEQDLNFKDLTAIKNEIVDFFDNKTKKEIKSTCLIFRMDENLSKESIFYKYLIFFSIEKELKDKIEIMIFINKATEELITSFKNYIVVKKRIENSNLLSKLSKTELEFFPQIASGKSLSEIARTNFRSRSAIVAHSTNIKRKLNLKNIKELIIFANELRM